MSGLSSDVESLLQAACDEFGYIESTLDVRNVHRTGVICAVWLRDLASARRHYAEAVDADSGHRERVRLALLRCAMVAATRGWWRVARRLAARA
jgi:hypothetical protein